jgi:diacylglycerol kinase (ATP)
MKRLWLAFRNTFDGINWAARHETAVVQELAALALAVPLSFYVTNSPWTRVALIGGVMLVLVVELLNTAIEKLCDHLAPELSSQIKVVKDLGSAAVFVAIVLAAAIWLIVLAHGL